MLWSCARNGAIAGVIIAGCWAGLAAAAMGFPVQPSAHPPVQRVVKDMVMVKLDAPVWLLCRFGASEGEVPGFCARLRADFQRQTGQALGDDAEPVEGARVLVVEVDNRGDHRALVTLAGGRQVAGKFVAQSTQEMRLGTVDAAMQAGSAAALVFPLASLLETLR